MKRSLRSWLWRVPVEQEIDEELSFHVEMRTRELVAGGMDPAAARRLARERLGNLGDIKRTCTDLGRKRDRHVQFTQRLEEISADVRFALRQLGRARGFTLVAVLTLALGIGANSAMFALVDATMLRPLPFPNPDRLVMLWERSPESAHDGVSPPDAADWNREGRSLERLGGFVPSVGGMVMAGADGLSETVSRQWVSSGIFDALGVKPVIGRTFVPDDDKPNTKVVVLEEGFWRSRFGADPSIVGRDLRLDGGVYTVVGVVPRQAQLIGRSSMWALIPIPQAAYGRPALRGAHMFTMIGRLKPDTTLAAAASNLSAVAATLAREYPSTNAGRGVTIEPLHDALIGRDVRLTSVLFLGVVGFVLLVCCVNVANLLMARATARTRELAVRSALGAGRLRIIRQLLTESLVLSIIGGAAGIGVGALILRAAPAFVPAGVLPDAIALTFTPRVLVFCAVMSLAVGVLFGLAPAWQGAGAFPAHTLASDPRTTTGRGGGIRSLLVAVEVATAVVLLFGAGLLLRTLAAVDRADTGYRADSVLTMMVDPLGSRYPTPAALLQFFDAIDRELAAVPGLAGAGWTSTLPMGDSVMGDVAFEVVGAPPAHAGQLPTADYAIASPSYFSTVDLPVVAGRAFDEHDTPDSAPVCIVNEAVARRYLNGRSPIGARIALRPADSPQAKPAIREVIGVARQVKRRPDETEALLQVYVPLAQDPTDDMYLVARPESGPADALTGGIRAAIARVDTEQLVSVRDIVTLRDIASGVTSRTRFRALLVATFAALALLLAMIGVFGILAFAVQQRAKEIAVRRALGARAAEIAGMLVRASIPPVAGGGAAGLAAAAALGPLLRAMLFGVRPFDPLTFTAVAAALAVALAVAVAVPAWRAVRVDPAEILRSS